MNHPKRHLLALLIFALAAVAFYAPVLFGGKSLLIDAIDHAQVYMRMGQRASWLEQGIVPLWDPRGFSGFSYVDRTPPTSVFHFQPWVMALFGFKTGYALCTLLFSWLACCGAYLLCHVRFGVAYWLAVAAGISFGFSIYVGGYYASIFCYFPFATFFFFFLFGALEARAWPVLLRNAFLGALPVIACMYSQEPRYLEFMVHSSLIIGVVIWFVHGSERRRLMTNLAAYAAVTGLCAALVSLPVLLPTLLETFHQQRQGAGESLPAVFRDIPYQQVAAGKLVGHLLPISAQILQDGIRFKLFGSYMTFAEYLHILFYPAILCGFFAYRSLRALDRTVFVTAVALLLISLFVSYFPGVLRLWTLLFKSGRFHDPDTSALFLLLAVFILADRILYWPASLGITERCRRILGKFLAVQGGILVLAVAGVIGIGFALDPVIVPYLTARRPDKFATILALAALFHGRMPYLVAAYVLLLVQVLIFRRALSSGETPAPGRRGIFHLCNFVVPLLVARAIHPFNSIPDRFDVRTPDRAKLASLSLLDRGGVVTFKPMADRLTTQQRARLNDIHSPRSLQFTMRLFPPAVMANTYHFVPKRVYRYWFRMYERIPEFAALESERRSFFYPVDDNLFHLLGVNYFFSELPIFSHPMRNAGVHGDYHFYVNDKALPRFFFVDRVKSMSGTPEGILDRLKGMPYDKLRSTAIVEEGEASSIVSRSYAGRRTVRLISYLPNRIVLASVCDREQFLVFTDTWDKRWKALVDGVEAKMYRTNYLFRGIIVPAGSRRIEMVYSYAPMRAYLIVAGVSVILLAAAIVIAVSRWANRRILDD